MKVIEKIEIQYVVAENDEEAKEIKKIISDFENAPQISSLAGFKQVHNNQLITNGIWK